ncbi:MAG: TlyA family RNA methyltransferase [Candidatus Limivicinus sp.]|jgi:23S rRNA (cytidine1920-2'-O)/16S rRNA (cytidine1409-2'-O)-methyltransferase
MKKIRLDQFVYELGLTESLERAKTTIMSGLVFVNGQRADKPGMQFPRDAKVEIHDTSLPFVSRGGFKLDKALKVFPVDPAGKLCIDCGASTGGFTDVLLQHGAEKVYSVDVGYGQLAWKLRNDKRVVNLERTNLRYITEEQVPDTLDLAVMDVSFISIKLVLPAIKKLLKENADIICLIKPQFEADRESVGEKGVVRDRAVHEEVVKGILDFAPSAGLTVLGLDFSPIKGPEGNIEYICYMKNAVLPPADIDVAAVVSASHAAL